MKEEALDRTIWRNRFGRGFGPVVWQITDDDDDDDYIAFMCFVWLSEQTVSFAVYMVNRLVFITEVESVYSAGRTETLYNTDTSRSARVKAGVTWSNLKSVDMSWSRAEWRYYGEKLVVRLSGCALGPSSVSTRYPVMSVSASTDETLKLFISGAQWLCCVHWWGTAVALCAAGRSWQWLFWIHVVQDRGSHTGCQVA